jgi:hypothetical protein
VIGNKPILDLPLNGRNPYSVLLTPGVIPTSGTDIPRSRRRRNVSRSASSLTATVPLDEWKRGQSPRSTITSRLPIGPARMTCSTFASIT